jgi:ATP-dependent RNA helicase RhlE
MMTTFAELNLSEPLAKALAAKGYTTPTPIQIQAIPHALAGRDLCGIAQTGTGKTAAFALPILDRLSLDPKPTPRHGCRVLVLSPTRELASQIAESFVAYGRNLKLQVATVFGGVPINRQIRQMERGVDVLVATPGRLIDLIEQRALTLSQVEVLVLDEADQMLDLGFIHALRRIVPLLPRRRQTLFFSATMPKSIADLAATYLTDPVQVAVAPVATTAERVEQLATFVNQAEKQALLTMWLRDPKLERALVFTRTKHGADRVVRLLEAAGIPAVAIHGNKSQPQRERALDLFKTGKSKVLVATDIAARGIDIDNVSHVFNFEIPNVPEQYVHRIGRTARAGASGLAVSFVADDERPYLRDIEKLTRQKVPVAPLPANFLAEVQKVKALRPAQPPRDEQPQRNFTGPGGHRGRPGSGRRAEGVKVQGQRRFGGRGR